MKTPISYGLTYPDGTRRRVLNDAAAPQDVCVRHFGASQFYQRLDCVSCGEILGPGLRCTLPSPRKSPSKMSVTKPEMNVDQKQITRRLFLLNY